MDVRACYNCGKTLTNAQARKAADYLDRLIEDDVITGDHWAHCRPGRFEVTDDGRVVICIACVDAAR